MTDWHTIHLGHLALSGAALLTIEATGVTPEGRISYGDTGLWSDETEAAMARVLAERAALVGHADRHPARPCRTQGFDGQAVVRRSADRPRSGEWLADGRALTHPVRRGRKSAARARPRRSGSPSPSLRGRRGACGSAGSCGGADPRGSRLSAAPVPVAALEPADGRIWRQPGEPHALPARSVRRGAGGVSRGPPGDRPPLCDGLGRGRLGRRIRRSVLEGAGGARMRGDPRFERRLASCPADPGRPKLPGAACPRDEAGGRASQSLRSA